MRGVADVERLRTRTVRMDDSIIPFEHRDIDCSGRSLATLLVAWVGAAMVASVLLRWKYMWIALTILTLLFLFACGYAACNARRAHERVLMSEEARIIERRRRDRNIQSVSGSVDGYPEIPDPPAYQAYWITDLPPPYAVVIGGDPPQLQHALPLARSGRVSESEPTSSSDGPRLSNPPPYSVAIQSEHQMTLQQTSRVGTSSLPERIRSIVDEPPSNSPREQVLTSTIAWDDDKNSNEQSNNTAENSQTLRTSGTLYLSNIISCTFGIGHRINADINSTAHTINRERPDIFTTTTITTSNQPSETNRNSATTL